MLKKEKRDNKGFTLVELVIVVAILAILVGLLAPQYTKYVEKTRKAADASNMDEMVKVVKVYAADPANELAAGDYRITITDGETTKVNEQDVKGKTDIVPVTSGLSVDELKKVMDKSIPKWSSITTKSKKWKNGSSSSISAIVTVGEDGGTSVKYCTGTEYSTTNNYFEKYMTTGSEQ